MGQFEYVMAPFTFLPVRCLLVERGVCVIPLGDTHTGAQVGQPTGALSVE
jgi:hypothetical protein